MGISNQRFWDYWNKGNYEEALKCPVEEEKKSDNRLQTMLFGTPDQMKQTGAVIAVSVGEFIYDYMMIHPAAAPGIDFARTEDLSSLFSLSRFSSGIDTSTLTGDFAQLQGYVAEQMVAAELQTKGYDVEFPETSNNPGWDILVDGQPFQVKNLASPEGVREHLNHYPDIPVYVNEELAPYFEGNPNVYVSGISREEVLEATSSTIEHADGLLDLEIPWISLGVSSIYNMKRVWKDGVTIQQAVFNVVSDTSSRVVLGALGQKAGILVGTFLFGPAGGIAGAMFGAYAGAGQGGRLSSGVKRAFSKKQEKDLNEAMISLLHKAVLQIDHKFIIKDDKLDTLFSHLAESEANDHIKNEVERRFGREKAYLMNKREELISFIASIQKGTVFVMDILPNAMALITKSGVHPVHIQDELKLVQQRVAEYRRKN